jgi:hypothetical protein
LNAFERDLERLISIVSLVKSYWILISVILFSARRFSSRRGVHHATNLTRCSAPETTHAPREQTSVPNLALPGQQGSLDIDHFANKKTRSLGPGLKRLPLFQRSDASPDASASLWRKPFLRTKLSQ